MTVREHTAFPSRESWESKGLRAAFNGGQTPREDALGIKSFHNCLRSRIYCSLPCYFNILLANSLSKTCLRKVRE